MIATATSSTVKVSSHSDRFSSSSNIKGEEIEYSRYDCGKYDSGADCMYINIRHKLSNGWSSLFSFEDDYVKREKRVKIGQNVRILREKMRFHSLDDKTFMSCLIVAMNLGPGDKERLLKSVKEVNHDE
ncbi:predicted protein [Naegleria gruberi]|uniref:Predicted protein n=1 Tax=Naegleria gruberi TaxID=5762 RepID=D2VXQ2_NAEGR|nr:uncharacterized protein NAEGRDRAFT_73829 [Naegleria gruberi]EFC38330.1 predicted protein [Naegleria gruberi]|eukprot:XP_002671074.1 predicted protein [Naegleria gruberi strain NEG-M]